MSTERIIDFGAHRIKGERYHLEASGKCFCCGGLIFAGRKTCASCGAKDILVFSPEDKRALASIQYFFKRK